MHLNFFPPMCYVRGGAERVHKRDDLDQLSVYTKVPDLSEEGSC